MNRIHRKTAIAKTGELILAAHDRGEGLLWGRYERQLPLCAFTDNGLNCRKCLNGPCRINPFGDEPNQGVCGADRDQIVMENLFQATLAGVLETARSMQLLLGQGQGPELPAIDSDLPLKTQKKLSEAGLIPVRKDQLFEVQNSYFSHKGYLSRTLADLTRLGLIHYGFLKAITVQLDKLLYDGPAFDVQGANILLVGEVPFDLIQSLHRQAGQPGKGKIINLFSQGGDAISSILKMADHGAPELALTMNLDALIIAPNAFLPALEPLAKKFDIPVILAGESKPIAQITSQTIDLALRHRQSPSYVTSTRIHPSPSSPSIRNTVFNKGKKIKEALQTGRIQGVVVILGETNVRQTFFERTLTLMENCLNKRCLVLAGGPLAAQADLLDEELAKRMGGQLSSRFEDLKGDELSPLTYFGSFYEIPRVAALLRDLSPGQAYDQIPVVVAFPEFFRASTWATAVSFLSMGFPVQIGNRLPFWGSPSLTEIVLKEWPKITGGTLMASPSLPNSQAQAEEIISFLEARKAGQK